MSKIISIKKAEFANKLKQSDTKQFSRYLFEDVYPNIDKLLEVFDNSGIDERNFCIPIEFFKKDNPFSLKNNLFREITLKKSIELIKDNISETGLKIDEITDIIFINTTGLSTPSMDACIVNSLKMNPNINRFPIWGLGCAGGVSGIAKANMIAKSNPDAIVLVVAVELCSLTFRRNDLSKSNFVATSLFSDGIASIIIAGEKSADKFDIKYDIEILSSQSRLYYDSEDVMGWEFLDDGFKVVFSKDIPTIVKENVKGDVKSFLKNNGISISDIENFIAHPGGAKVIQAYIDSLELNSDKVFNTREILRKFGNMSSVSVLYVLEKFLSDGFTDGNGLMISLGPGFSSEMVLLEMKNRL